MVGLFLYSTMVYSIYCYAIVGYFSVEYIGESLYIVQWLIILRSIVLHYPNG